MSRIAAISDAHLPDRSDTIKDAVLDWTLGDLRTKDVDLLVVAGDMTSLGTAAAATRLRHKLDRLDIPFLFTPGNAELRTPAQTRQVLDTLHTPPETAEVIALDTSRMHLTDADRDRLCVLCQRAEPIFAVTHCPPGFLPQEDQTLFRMALDAGKLLPLLTGHIHRDQIDGRRQSIRGLDPDRACAAPAGFAVFDSAQGTWERQDFSCPLDNPATWGHCTREDFLEHLGISAFVHPTQEVVAAGDAHIPCLEIPAMAATAEGIGQALEYWRSQGGDRLSVLLPMLTPDRNSDPGVVAGVRFAIACGAQMVTLPMPGNWTAGELAFVEKRRSLAARYGALLRPLLDAGLTIGFENLSLRQGEPYDSRRRYGCTPLECREWIQLMRGQLDGAEIGLTFDLAHARNNRKLASRYNPSEWYAELGSQMVAAHLHQIRDLDGRPTPHCHFDTLFDPYIHLGGFLMAWNIGQVRHGPLFLEIHHGSPVDSWRHIRGLVG
ncbi:MAG: hypothetical protein IJJ33_18950 [Victivallales bacterium]|nr:hypothetical protein [Victivallales bacterium]